MTTLTIRLPDDTTERLRVLAKSRKLSVNKLFEEMSIQAIASFDAQTRFRAMAERSDIGAALAVLDRLDALDAGLSVETQRSAAR
jgi:predicted transcriptional regulator